LLGMLICVATLAGLVMFGRGAKNRDSVRALSNA